MKCNKCGEELYYSGGCNGEWEHPGKYNRCDKKDIKNHKLTKLKHQVILAQHQLNIAKSNYKKILEEE